MWEIRPGEQREAYAAFARWLTSRPTPEATYARELGRTEQWIRDTAVRWGWRERAAEYDLYLASLRLDMAERAAIKRAEAYGAGGRAAAAMMAVVERNWERMAQPSSPALTERELIAATRAAGRFLRDVDPSRDGQPLALGQTAAPAIDLTRLTDEELEAYTALVTKAASSQ